MGNRTPDSRKPLRKLPIPLLFFTSRHLKGTPEFTAGGSIEFLSMKRDQSANLWRPINYGPAFCLQ